MNLLTAIINKILIFEKAPQKVGLSQLREKSVKEKNIGPSLKNKDIKLSDLMRRAS